jgi:hypothetical protein
MRSVKRLSDTEGVVLGLGGAGIVFFRLIIFCGVLWVFGTGLVRADLKAELDFEGGEFMRRTAYRAPDKLAAGVSQSGAQEGVNEAWERSREGVWFIEEQRHGAAAVVAGVFANNRAAVERGIRALRWGFQQQQEDGSFLCRDTYHSASFFLEAAAHACLILQAAPMGREFQEDLAWLKPRMLKTALWMTRPDVEPAGKRRNAPYTHRYYMVAAALGQTGVVCENADLIRGSWAFIEEGLAAQAEDGNNPEKGGMIPATTRSG